MALKEYEWRGHTWQFEEGEQPRDARPVEPKAAPSPDEGAKAHEPANKARKTANKKAE